MMEPVPPDRILAPTLIWLGTRPRASLERLAERGFRRVQLSAAHESIRPRDLDRSGRRELLALLRRLDVAPGGLDVPVPAERLPEERAVLAHSVPVDPRLSRRSFSAAMAGRSASTRGPYEPVSSSR